MQGGCEQKWSVTICWQPFFQLNNMRRRISDQVLDETVWFKSRDKKAPRMETTLKTTTSQKVFAADDADADLYISISFDQGNVKSSDRRWLHRI